MGLIPQTIERGIKETNYAISANRIYNQTPGPFCSEEEAVMDSGRLCYVIWLTGVNETCNITIADILTMAFLYTGELMDFVWAATFGRTIYKRC